MPFKSVERNLTDIIEDLRPDPVHSRKADQRYLRATGTALKVPFSSHLPLLTFFLEFCSFFVIFYIYLLIFEILFPFCADLSLLIVFLP
jgi:hypothetical protein